MPFAPPVDTLNRGRATLWGNLGEWSQASGYPEAAAALARHLGEAAGLGPDHIVIDVGSGAGDQLRLWVEGFGVEQVTGVERDPALAARARRRITEWGLDDRLRVVTGSGDSDDWTGDGTADRVLALDSAYFFESRAAFLRRCRTALRPDGVLALTDLVLGEGGSAPIARGLAPAFGVPRENLVAEARYRAVLAECGFDRIRLRDLTRPVLEGFAAWTRARGHRRAGAPPWWDGVGLSVTGRAAGFLARSGGLRYAMVTAQRRGP